MPCHSLGVATEVISLGSVVPKPYHSAGATNEVRHC